MYFVQRKNLYTRSACVCNRKRIEVVRNTEFHEDHLDEGNVNFPLEAIVKGWPKNADWWTGVQY